MSALVFSRCCLSIFLLFSAPLVVLASAQSEPSKDGCYVTIENKTGEEHYFMVGKFKYELKSNSKVRINLPHVDTSVPSGAAGGAVLAGRLLASTNANLTIKQARNPCGKSFSLTKNYVLGPRPTP